MKKIAAILGGFFALILVAIIVIPLMVDVDKYRPQIVKAANEQLNGTLELGKLSLSLWGKIHVGVDGLALKDSQQRQLVGVKVASFDMPYTSIFSGAPLVTLRMVQPDIAVVKGKDGKLNLMSLMKVAPSSAQTGAPANGAASGSPATNTSATNTAATKPAPTTTAAAPTTASSQKIELPSMAVNAHVGVSIEDAKLTYKDEVMALTNTIDQFNLRVKDFSLSRKTELELWADLKTKMGTDLSVEGPLKLIAELTPELSGGEFKSAAVTANFTADDLTIDKGVLFMKKKGVPANFKFDGVLSQDTLKLNKASAQFFNAEIVVSGDYNQVKGANIHFEAKPIDLNPWSELVPMLKEYELEGKVGLSGEAKGTADALQYAAKLTVENFAAKGPMLKAKPVVNAEVDIATDRIEKIYVNLKGPGNELLLNAKLLSFSKPQLTFAVTSPKGLDLDQWIEFPKSEAKGTAKKEDKKEEKPATAAAPSGNSAESASAKANTSASGSASTAGTAGSSADFDAMLDPLRKNEMAKAMTVDGSVSIAFIKAMGIRIDDIGLKMQLKNLVAALTGLKMKMYDGTIAGGFTVDLKPQHPQYSMNLSVTGFDIQKAVESQFQSFKDTIVGKLSTTMTGAGSSFNPDEIKKKLQLKGDFKIANASFKTMDIAKMANEAISGTIAKIASKVPALQGKKLNASSNGGAKYEMVSSNYTINGGFLDAPNFIAKAAPKAGVDIKGATKMGLVDESLDAKWELTDTQRVTGADQLNPPNPVGGGTINNILAKSEKDAVTFPITVGCKWSSPCVNYSASAEYLAGVVAGRLAKGLGEGAKAKAVSAVQKALGNSLPAGNPLKKLFGH